jgi:nicotinamidase-related amidase
MIVTGDPYDFPITGALDPQRTALLVIDMQRDFCDPSGYMNSRGDDVNAARAIVPRILAALEVARCAGMLVIYTREGHRANLSDLPENKRLKTARAGAQIGTKGPLGRLLIRGEVGWDFIDEMQPLDEDVVIDKVGTGAFHATELHDVLRNRRIENVVLTGVTTGVCVSSTAREATDRGYSVLVLEDCCAEPDPQNHDMAIQLLKIEDGYLATISSSELFINALQTPATDLDQYSSGINP